MLEKHIEEARMRCIKEMYENKDLEPETVVDTYVDELVLYHHSDQESMDFLIRKILSELDGEELAEAIDELSCSQAELVGIYEKDFL